MPLNRGKYKRTVRNQNKDNRPQAHGRYIRVSDLKARVVLNQIKNKDAKTAMAILSYSPRKAAEIVLGILKSAVANAEYKYGLDPDTNPDPERLFVQEAIANQGPVMKRIKPKAKGRAYPILKRTSHITIILNER